MTDIDRRAADMQVMIQGFMAQFQSVNAAAANGPHAILNMQELRVIDFLGSEGRRMMRELAEHLSVAVNSMTSIVDSLENKGFVCRQRSDDDRRVVRVELTDAGRVIQRSHVETKRQLFRSMLDTLTEDEQEIFIVLFRKIARAGRAQVQQGISSN